MKHTLKPFRPPPRGPRFGPQLPIALTRDRHRLHLCANYASRYNRVFGLFDGLGVGSQSDGAVDPASFQVVTKV